MIEFSTIAILGVRSQDISSKLLGILITSYLLKTVTKGVEDLVDNIPFNKLSCLLYYIYIMRCKVNFIKYLI